MNTKKNVCLVFRGELLRNSQSTYHRNQKNKHLREPNLSEEAFIRQDDIMKSIINHIILPYEKSGFNVFISGCIYKCNHYDNKLKEFFPNNTIKQIQPGKTNQAELYYQSIEQAEKEHPECIEYISLRVDYIMLKNIIRKDLDLNLSYVGFAWKNPKCNDVDVFYIISKNAVNVFKNILYHIGKVRLYVETHKITQCLKNNKVLLYPIWNNYENKATGIGYSAYIANIKLHENRPFVNYMRAL
jgi:hypothetical protein